MTGLFTAFIVLVREYGMKRLRKTAWLHSSTSKLEGVLRYRMFSLGMVRARGSRGGIF